MRGNHGPLRWLHGNPLKVIDDRMDIQHFHLERYEKSSDHCACLLGLLLPPKHALSVLAG